MVENRCEQLWPFEHKERADLGSEHTSPPHTSPFPWSLPPLCPTAHQEQTTGFQAGHHLVCPARRADHGQGVTCWGAGEQRPLGRAPWGKSLGWGGLTATLVLPPSPDVQSPRGLGPGNIENQGQRPGWPVGKRRGQDLRSHSLQAPQPPSGTPEGSSCARQLRAPGRRSIPGQSRALPMVTKCPSLP